MARHPAASRVSACLISMKAANLAAATAGVCAGVRGPGAGAAPRSPQLVRALAEQLARDHELLDLLRALEDVEDLRVPGPLLEQLLLAVAGCAAERDAAERHL